MVLDLEECDTKQLGSAMHQLIADLYPICRSITGDGVRKTLHILQQYIPLEVHEVPTGTQIFDWTVPKEWNIRDAYVKNQKGEKVIDFRASNLHILGYSIPIHQKMPFSELRKHLITLPDHPDWIPSRTSYFEETWGFCLTHHVLQQLEDGEYEVYIDSSLEAGHLTYGEYYLPGELEDEVLFSCHVCHPSLCNDNLSGIALATFLANHLRTFSRRYSYRFLFIPTTFGSITWLALNEENVYRIKHGLVLAGVGDAGNITYKTSRLGNAEIDQVFAHTLKNCGKEYSIEEFSPYGYDERQFCSPGFNLPIGRLSRTPFGTYPQYHTSADNLDFVKPDSLAESLAVCKSAVDLLENNRTYQNQNPKCEPQLGKRGIYQGFGSGKDQRLKEMAMLWILNFSDGTNSLLDISKKSGLPFEVIQSMAELLRNYDLLKEI